MTAARRNPAKDQVAFASAATTGFARSSGDVTAASLALEASIKAIKAAGIDKSEINGLIGANNGYTNFRGSPAIARSRGPRTRSC